MKQIVKLFKGTKPLLVYILYTVKIDGKDPWGHVSFSFYPNLISYYLFVILLLPFVFVYCGILGIVGIFEKPNKRKFSSYHFKDGEKQTKWNACKKF